MRLKAETKVTILCLIATLSVAARADDADLNARCHAQSQALIYISAFRAQQLSPQQSKDRLADFGLGLDPYWVKNAINAMYFDPALSVADIGDISSAFLLDCLHPKSKYSPLK